jgi:hypothetical protein
MRCIFVLERELLGLITPLIPDVQRRISRNSGACFAIGSTLTSTAAICASLNGVKEWDFEGRHWFPSVLQSSEHEFATENSSPLENGANTTTKR